MNYTDAEKKLLGRIGRSEDGRELAALLSRMKQFHSSIDGIEGGDYGAQVEGRKLFIQFADDFIGLLTTKERTMKYQDVDDYRS